MTSASQRGLCRHFGIDRQPFSIAPDPRFLYLGAQHQEALAHLLYGVAGEGGFIVLTGEVGTGKTTLCRALLHQLPDNSDVAFIVHPGLTADELLRAMCDELGLHCESGRGSGKDRVDLLTDHLLRSHAQGRHTVLIIDEAQNLSAAVLEQIRLLTNLETDDRKLLQLILIGQPELGQTLASERLRQLAQRVTARYHLSNLSRAETTRYVDHRLKVAGYCGRLFTPAAKGLIFRKSGGTPRLINRLCDRAMLGAYVLERGKIGPAIVRRAWREMGVPESSEPAQTDGRRWWRVAARRAAPALILFALLLGLVALTPPGLRQADRIAVYGQQAWHHFQRGIRERQRIAEDDRRAAALRQLASLWRVELPRQGALCDGLQQQVLSCLQLELSADQIRHLSLPGVAEVDARGESDFRLISAGSDLDALDASEQESFRYWVFWREPPRTAADWPYRQGQQHAGVAWLQQRLAWWRGNPHFWLQHASAGRDMTSASTAAGADGATRATAVTAAIEGRSDWILAQAPRLLLREHGGSFGAEIEQEIRTLQRELGWAATGEADLLTLLKLDALTNVDSPQLVRSIAWVQAG